MGGGGSDGHHAQISARAAPDACQLIAGSQRVSFTAPAVVVFDAAVAEELRVVDPVVSGGSGFDGEHDGGGE